ncbi:TonB-dependent receptor [Solidesulfovibrio fructosivorans JJ]]|uniref:TonB-dependent receptor n=1 Tax=Solidesulfovibrio fructosivorans JJ] TaxID=596151 RepID=E1JU67_SOLFR|nr:TonB-dependent receptor [Solidesulfovibrio fructosivorans]EFL51997.1 TonB-dependent receptor [Solidesulfovibrio fructosivorans JJ]]
MRTPRFITAVLALLCLLPCGMAQGQDRATSEYDMGEAVVTGKKTPGPLQEEQSQPATETVLDQDTVTTFAGPGQTNPYRALNLLPSVNAEGTDPYGLVQDQNSLRIRGQSASTYGRLSRTIEGLPIGINVGNGSMGNFLDMENVSSLSLGRGPIAADKGFGFGNSAGALDMLLRKPADTPGATFSEQYGSFGFTRSFARLDTGESPLLGTRFLGSASYSQTDKWRGKGYTDRTNIMAGLAQPLFYGHVRLEAYGIYNAFHQDEYRPLTYAQTQNMSLYRGFDFTGERTGDTTTDYAYYGYNYQDMQEWTVFGKLEADLWSGGLFSFKPYYAGDGGSRRFTNVTSIPSKAKQIGFNLNAMRESQWGFVAQIEQDLHPVKLKGGFWYQYITAFPPPVAGQRFYTLQTWGNSFGGWKMLNTVGERLFKAPFIQASGDFGKLHATAGLKYLSASMPRVTSYDTSGVPDVSYDDARDYSSGVVTSKSTDATEKHAWLPNVGLSYDLTDNLTARAMYGRNYAYPLQGPLYSAYNSNAAAFLAQGITLQHLWNDIKLETSDNIDVGLRYNNGVFSIAPTLFYAYYHHKQVTAYDSLIGASYLQPGADARSFGAELEVSWKALSWLTLFGSGSYNNFQFTKNINSSLGTTLRVRNNQVPDVPLWLGKLGATATYDKFKGTVLYRYVDSRYGDVQNHDYIRPYNIVDLYLSYDLPPVFRNKECKLTLDVLNLFDERYVATIRSASDDTQTASATYYPGSPLTVVGGITITF